eukprot:CAMPEP_0179876178 /NCGR_PEP_ID=MMETSP0982-20121206/24051_1 /TAXON_ID=483367 /ORGANISM="non described non described, Strain CCMP 2436" /LENGTH=93 /DNA_ID=CAMNT_0021768559 /DNA_START=66 /DNA_END=347 /DNA_ORIENTATION=-
MAVVSPADFLPPIASGDAWLARGVDEDAVMERREREYSSMLLTIAQADYPILGMSAHRTNNDMDDPDPDDDGEDDDEELDDQPETDSPTRSDR